MKLKMFSKRNKKITIEFCQKNIERFITEDHFTQYEGFLNQKSITYKEYECQSICKECKKTPYALVDGLFISSNDASQLLIEIKRHIDNN